MLSFKKSLFVKNTKENISIGLYSISSEAPSRSSSSADEQSGLSSFSSDELDELQISSSTFNFRKEKN
jgi:hypothetical protein